MKTSAAINNASQRILAIDALRGVVLLGILLVHASQLFSFAYTAPDDATGTMLSQSILYFLSDRCNKVFAVLFGVSFYLILRKKDYTTTRFIWRCIILSCIGLCVKAFYSFEVLFWFGIMGIFLCSMRRLRCETILFVSVGLFVSSVILSHYDIGTKLWGEYINNRYLENSSLTSILLFSPLQAIKDNVHEQLDKGVLYPLTLFCFGYYLGKKGWVEHYKNFIDAKAVLAAFFVYVLTVYISLQFPFWYLIQSYNLVEALACPVIVLWLYGLHEKLFFPFACYGRMGLTNYVAQCICGVVIVNTIIT